jgi:hypothetical protein
MELWIKWMSLVDFLRASCSRQRTFYWVIVSLIGFTIKFDSNGVTSLARGIGLLPGNYTSLLHLFYSSALNLEKLRQCWINIVITKFNSAIKINNRFIIVGDGIKIGKEGKKIPGVKCLHQDSQTNSKAKFIMGHSIQAISIIVKGLSNYFAVPLVGEIHEGFNFDCRDKRTLLNKMFDMLISLKITEEFYFVADRYYCSGRFLKLLTRSGNHLITMMKRRAVAYYLPVNESKRKGRPKKYGVKIKLFDLFNENLIFTEAYMPGNPKMKIEYHSINLLWRPYGALVKFILVRHPVKGKSICMTTDLSLEPLSVIWSYSVRFKIEVTFKQAVHQVGTFMYHFWIRKMKPTKRSSKEKL